MCFESSNALLSVVVVDSQMEVIGTADEPVLPRDKSDGPYWDLCDFECLDKCTCLMVPYEDIACVQAGLLYWNVVCIGD